MTSVSIMGSFMVICGERPVACFATRLEARAHAEALRARLGEVECFICEVMEMISAIGPVRHYHDIRIERQYKIAEAVA